MSTFLQAVALWFLIWAPISSSWTVDKGHARQRLVRFSHNGGDELQESTPASPSVEQSTRRQWMTRVSQALASPFLLPQISHADDSKSKSLQVVTSTAVCDSTVSVWKQPNRKRLVYILGTAHISEISANLARQLVQDVRPDAVFVELDLKRVGGVAKYAMQAQKQQQQQLDGVESPAAPSPPTRVIVPIVSSTFDAMDPSTPALPPEPTAPPTGIMGRIQQRALNFGANALGNAVRNMYKNLGKAGFQPGEEFMAAITEGQKVGAAVVLGDQDVEYTLRRLTQALAVTDFNKLNDEELQRKIGEILPSGPGNEPPALPTGNELEDPQAFKQELATYVEKLKSRDSVRKIMAELKQAAPALVQVMLTERDAFMAVGLDTLDQFECIVAVMGIAHMDGVEQNLRSRGWTPALLKCPR